MAVLSSQKHSVKGKSFYHGWNFQLEQFKSQLRSGFGIVRGTHMVTSKRSRGSAVASKGVKPVFSENGWSSEDLYILRNRNLPFTR